MKSKKTTKFWFSLALILFVVSMLGASIVQTNGGKVTVKDLRWETPAGKLMSALLFIPDTATAENPAPAIVTSHGWYNNREMQDLNYVEYARRGYVVMSIDMYGHGNSDALLPDLTAYRATGMTDAVELIAALPYVDASRIGVTGHSNGARAANLAVDDDLLKETPLISAVLLVANNATYQNPDKEFYNKYGNRSVGIVAALYDEFFFRTYEADGTIIAPREFINNVNAQSFLNFGQNPEGLEKRSSYTIYSKMIDGKDAIRVIFNPKQIHPWNHISTKVVDSSIVFFEKALGAPNPIASSNQIWPLKTIFNTLGLFAFAIFVYQFLKILLNTKYFSTLKADTEVAPFPAPTGKAKVWFWVSLALGQIFSGFVFLKIFAWANKVRPPFFVQGPVWYIGVWAALVGLFTLVLLIVGWYLFDGKKSGISMKDRGVAITGKGLWKTILLALAVVSAAFAIVFLSDYLFKVDFRLWVIPLKAFTPDKFRIILMYLPFFLVFYLLNSVAINAFNYFKLGKKDTHNIALLAFVNALNVLVIVVVQYLYFWANGRSFTELVVKPPVSNIVGIWLFPLLVYLPLTAVFTRLVYKLTRNPYLGGLIFALIMTIIACTNTLTYAL